ncbi:MAG: HAD-IIB family hydrolase [Kiritimatiellia bacterium]
MTVIATDLDRTLFPNGKQEYDNSMRLFGEIVRKREIPLIYVTGRNRDQILEGMEKYDPPLPLYAVAEVGTKIYDLDGREFTEDKGYIRLIEESTRNWDVEAFKNALASLADLRLQEARNQNEFKLSYYLDHPEKGSDTVEAVKKAIGEICPDFRVIYSVDETRGRGLLDVLPRAASKLEALEYLRGSMKVQKEEIIYCGDSGNDLLPLTAGYRAIVVRNAIPEVKTAVKEAMRSNGMEHLLRVAEGMGELNGYYVSGIIEGLVRFGEIPEDFTLKTPSTESRT